MDNKTYQKMAIATNKYHDQEQMLCLTALLCSEAGEVAGKVDKHVRHTHDIGCHQLTCDQRHALALELGDVLWSLTNIAAFIGYDLDLIMQLNIDKLAARDSRHHIDDGSEGDDR